MSDRIELIARIGAAMATADPATHAVLRDALAAIVEDSALPRAESQRRSRRSSYVYYARSGDQVKIGVSRNPWARLRELQVARPDIALVGVEPGDSTLERERHVQFGADRLAGEWFRWSAAVSAHVATVALRSNDCGDVVATSSPSSPPSLLSPEPPNNSSPPSPPPSAVVRVSPPRADVELVVAHYVRRHPKRRPGGKDRKLIERHLATYSPAELCEAIDGNADDEWAIRTGKHELTWVLRDNGQIDTYRAKADVKVPAIVDGWFADVGT